MLSFVSFGMLGIECLKDYIILIRVNELNYEKLCAII